MFGKFPVHEELIEVVSSRVAISIPLDNVQANSTRIYFLGTQNEQQKAIDLGAEVLCYLDERFPSRLCNAHLMSEFRSVKKLLKGRAMSS